MLLGRRSRASWPTRWRPSTPLAVDPEDCGPMRAGSERRLSRQAAAGGGHADGPLCRARRPGQARPAPSAASGGDRRVPGRSAPQLMSAPGRDRPRRPGARHRRPGGGPERDRRRARRAGAARRAGRGTRAAPPSCAGTTSPPCVRARGTRGRRRRASELFGLTVTAPGSQDGPRLCLDGHVDVVAPGTEEWRLGPWSGRVAGGLRARPRRGGHEGGGGGRAACDGGRARDAAAARWCSRRWPPRRTAGSAPSPPWRATTASTPA